MTTNEWLPPLLCPIPKGHVCHANYESSSRMLSNILKRYTFKTSSTLNLFRDKSVQRNTSDDLPQPSTYYRLFCRRTSDKNIKHKKRKPQYVIFDPNGKFIRHDHTLQNAQHHLSMDSVIVVNRFRKRVKKEVPIGSFVLKIVDDPEVFNWDTPSIDDLAPVAVKRCKACPNKTSTQGICHCGFWSAIKDSTASKVWWPIHDRKMYDIRMKKEKTERLKIKISLLDLFED
jgi:hypothetical protein